MWAAMRIASRLFGTGVVFIPVYAMDLLGAWWPLGVTVLVLGIAALLSAVGRALRPAPQPR